MEANKVDTFMMMNAKYFESHQLMLIREELINADDSRWGMIQTMQYKDPTIALIIGIVGGTLGIDRFYIGDVTIGIFKLLTCGGLGIWALVDLFLIMGATREKNLKLLQMALFG